MVLLLLVGLSLLVVAPADAREPCIERGNGTAAMNATFRVYYVGDSSGNHLACRLRGGRSWKLGVGGNSDYAESVRVRLAGRYVAFAGASVSSQIRAEKLFVMDLGTHRRRGLTEASVGEAPLEDEEIGQFVVTRRGAVAWIRRVLPADGPPASQLEADRGDGHETFDAGPDVDGGSLAVTPDGRRLYWTNAGEPRSARLR